MEIRISISDKIFSIGKYNEYNYVCFRRLWSILAIIAKPCLVMLLVHSGQQATLKSPFQKQDGQGYKSNI